MLPDRPVAAAYSQLVQSLTKTVLLNIHESRTLAELRDALLPRLISGQVRIEDAERFLDLQERGRRTSADGKHHGPI